MLVTKQIEIDMAHRVPNHKSKCRNLHGHRYKIEVGVDDKVIAERGSSSEGMVIDFGDLKEIMMQELDAKFDHNAVFNEEDQMRPLLEETQKYQSKAIHFVPFIPTAENLAAYWYGIMKVKLQEVGIRIKYLKIWETPTSTAMYEENN